MDTELCFTWPAMNCPDPLGNDMVETIKTMIAG